MTYQPTELLTVYLDAGNEHRKVGRLASRDRQILFEYDPGFLASGIEISPIKLPRRPGVQIYHYGQSKVPFGKTANRLNLSRC